MPPTLILIRHAQAEHNIDPPKFYNLPDPPLSNHGRSQCAKLRENLKDHPLAQKAELVVVSPMRRTCETAMLSVDWLLDSGVKTVADALWQENSDKPCDTGSTVSTVAPSFPRIDFSDVDPVYPDKTSPAGAAYAYNRQAVVARGQAALKKLHGRPEKVIVVVSHAGFLRQGVTGSYFVNADYRVFDFEERAEGEEGDYRLKQWVETEKKGGGMGESWKLKVPIGQDLPEAPVREENTGES